MPGIIREGNNLFSNVNIDYTDAILGTVAQVANSILSSPSDMHISVSSCAGDMLPRFFFNLLIGSACLQVQTVEGEKQLEVPAGTQPDETLMLPKLGSPKLNKPTSRGDHYFTVKVKIPTRLR